MALLSKIIIYINVPAWQLLYAFRDKFKRFLCIILFCFSFGVFFQKLVSHINNTVINCFLLFVVIIKLSNFHTFCCTCLQWVRKETVLIRQTSTYAWTFQSFWAANSFILKCDLWADFVQTYPYSNNNVEECFSSSQTVTLMVKCMSVIFTSYFKFSYTIESQIPCR